MADTEPKALSEEREREIRDEFCGGCACRTCAAFDDLLAELDRQRALWARVEAMLHRGYTVSLFPGTDMPVRLYNQWAERVSTGETLADAVAAAPEPQQTSDGECEHG